MPFSVNGQLVPEELIRQESERIGRDRQWLAIADEAERARRLRAAAECSAADQILLAQIASADPRPIDSGTPEAEVKRQKTQWACRSGFDDTTLCRFIEHQLRLQRTNREIVAGSPQPTPEQIEAFYNAHRDHFQKPEMFHAAHIVKHVTHEQSEEQAEAGILAALADLERGEPFAKVAARHSDCSDKGGDLGQFPAGHMVQEFEDAIRALEPGHRTGVFTTPFGFHIAELKAKTPAGPAGLEEVRAEIARVLTFAGERETFVRAMGQLRSRAEIRWVPAFQTAAS